MQLNELEDAQRVAVQEILSYVQSTPVLREAAHAKKLEDNPEWAIILGLGYNDVQRRNLIYVHLKKLLAELHSITSGDALKAKQLTDLLYCRAHAGEKRRLDAMDKAKMRQAALNDDIVRSLQYFVRALHDAGGDGRHHTKVRQAQNVIATAVSKAAAFSHTNTSTKDISEALGLNPRMVTKCQARFDALTDGEWEQLFDDHQATRSDKMSEVWRDFGLLFWTDPDLADEQGNALNFVRRSERMSDEIRDPANRKSLARYRIFWLEERINVMYATMLRMGKALHGETFTMGWKYFLSLRPFYVKDATRETCMCVYHLRWREFANGLLKYRKAVRHQKISNCSCTIPINEKFLRQQLICQRIGQVDSGSQSLDNLPCILQTCQRCKDLSLLTSGPGSLCTSEMRDPEDGGEALEVRYESFEKITYRTKVHTTLAL